MQELVFVEVIFALGANLNDPEKQIYDAINFLNQYFPVNKISSLYRSQSILKDDQADYYNLVVSAKSKFSPQDILKIIKKIETTMGRKKTKRWGERLIDIDIIDYDRQIIKAKGLEIPHNQMYKRSFVLIPLQEIIPDYIHPVYKKSVQEMIYNLSEDYNIKQINRFLLA